MHADNMTELIVTFNRGDQRSFQKIFQLYYKRLLRIAITYVDAATADEIVIDKFAKLWEKRGFFEKMDYIEGFLFTSVRNACYNSIKSQKGRQKFEKQYSKFLNPSEKSIEEQIIFAEVMQKVYAEIESLSPQLKRVFILKYIQGFKNPVIARKLNTTVQNVRNLYYQACKQLRTKLLKRDPDIL